MDADLLGDYYMHTPLFEEKVELDCLLPNGILLVVQAQSTESFSSLKKVNVYLCTHIS